MELLWTDLLLFILLTGIAGFIFYASKREHLRAPWRQVFSSKQAVAALVVLSVYVAIGSLDSIHYKEKDTGQIISLLDSMLSPIRTRVEKTYSAPLAIYSFEKVNMERDGKKLRDYPRLDFGGKHIVDTTKHGSDVFWLGSQGLLLGMGLSILLAFALIVLLSLYHKESIGQYAKKVIGGDTQTPWNIVILTCSIIIIIAAIMFTLSSKYFVLGTDRVGNDVFFQAIKSIRTGLLIGTLTTLIMMPFAVLLGAMAGYFRGLVDDIIQYLYTTLNSIPGILLIVASVLMVQVYINNNPDLFATELEKADIKLLALCAILGITSWTGLCRLLRGETMKLREVDFVQAATAFGVGRFTVIMRHIIPNFMHIVLIAIVLDFSGLVLAEAVLSYIGVGVDPSMNSWGTMINSARLEMAREPIVWWSLAAAFTFMFVLVLAANLFSDAVRDAFDPRLRRQ